MVQTDSIDRLPNGWRPRFFEPGDEEAVLEVLMAAFGRWPGTDVQVSALEHLRWKVNGPLGASRHAIVAELGGRIVGWQAYLKFNVRVDGTLLVARQSVDSCVHPEFQRLGIKAAMRNYALDNARRDHQLTFALSSGHPGMRRIRERYGRPGRRYLANQIQVLEHRRQRALEGVESRQTFVIRSVGALDERMESFWRQASAPFDLIVERSRERLNWRYADPRAGRFRIALAEDAGEVLGYVVTSVSRRKGHIADVLALPDRLDVVGALVRFALDDLAEDSPVRCWLPTHHQYREVFLHCGFAPTERTVPLVCRPSKGSSATMKCGDDPHAAIHVMIGDTDLV